MRIALSPVPAVAAVPEQLPLAFTIRAGPEFVRFLLDRWPCGVIIVERIDLLRAAAKDVMCERRCAMDDPANIAAPTRATTSRCCGCTRGRTPTLTFPGDNWSAACTACPIPGARPFAGPRPGRAEIEFVVERYVGNGIQMEVEDILVNGPPWEPRVAVVVHDWGRRPERQRYMLKRLPR